jgi:hypothetical protein
LQRELRGVPEGLVSGAIDEESREDELSDWTKLTPHPLSAGLNQMSV